MIERLLQLHRTPTERLASARLCDPCSYPSMPPLDSNSIAIQLYVLPSFHPMISWTLFRGPDSTFTVRRVRWDFIADYQLTRQGVTVSTPATYGADAICPPRLVEAALAELGSLSVPAFDPANCLGIDGVTFGFRRCSFSQSLEFSWWSHPPAGCEAVAAWHHRFTGQMEDILPSHTDQLRISAIRP